jgi:hypothetical protein
MREREKDIPTQGMISPSLNHQRIAVIMAHILSTPSAFFSMNAVLQSRNLLSTNSWIP